MDALIFSQIMLNGIASVVIVLVGVCIAVIASEFTKFLKTTAIFLTTLNNKFSEGHNITDILVAGVSSISFISKLFKRRKEKNN